MRPLIRLLLCLMATPSAQAHFQELIPSSDVLSARDSRRIELTLTFTHPMAGGPAMAMGTPQRFGVLGPQGDQNLLDTLQPQMVDGQNAYRASYPVTRPGNYLFYLEPAPYWEPGEGKMIIHYTKVIVDAYDYQQGWQRDAGMPVEIEPLTRPFGLWSGNLFQGIVKQQGQPVPFAEVEVEWRNDGSLTPPNDSYLTQVIRADANGVFSYVMPRAGWWGFAALVEAEQPMVNPAGKPVPVELGGLIWVYTRDMR
ncbi:DUF4198 domain-containing protein [Motiliproteus sediminis]|uniref:DUF4198 domain-containing protein n=1 Tax=Motiliproteus sediminis TaxID=1468178 RepID=UPI001AEF94DA|nr:DUF4198 domain-containing protein [Motiliproteus sediminis]